MARIPSTEIERLCREVSVERLAEARSLKLVRDNDKLVGTCSFHDDGNHVFVVDPKANTWTRPECKVTNGTIIEWTMKAEGSLNVMRSSFCGPITAEAEAGRASRTPPGRCSPT